MTHSVSNLHEAQTVMVGVDTHKHMHVAVAIDSRGIRLGAHSFGADDVPPLSVADRFRVRR